PTASFACEGRVAMTTQPHPPPLLPNNRKRLRGILRPLSRQSRALLQRTFEILNRSPHVATPPAETRLGKLGKRKTSGASSAAPPPRPSPPPSQPRAARRRRRINSLGLERRTASARLGFLLLGPTA
ncbi:unnamed protein product, partial [Nesidiocoris tenuis]